MFSDMFRCYLYCFQATIELNRQFTSNTNYVTYCIDFFILTKNLGSKGLVEEAYFGMLRSLVKRGFWLGHIQTFHNFHIINC